ncbi:ATP-dependent (S)-NAD(P)H-hydrate dehydratase [Toxorhynchites rutilus septentrionalis]|uniref:ATP-dependent (S)-NAD(P)H-hydrate dehydratase n=1 Tax=Toxorhynchites rutilus septentrionalis TaxID=329112 RepID=UPI00247A001E|nr:ATP-dependent (S)-NAD(P)H-hydrate dehydratase [Toxorhynchites rutilus septentrionalis]XP_055624734.1 ATP-dependent (S)-NAD(P)H-hydrate dehydratase [Toxorhynchites rutilus septentrionalis]
MPINVIGQFSTLRRGLVSYCSQQNIPKFVRCQTATIMTDNNTQLLERARSIVPQLAANRHKGQAGRIGVIGGSYEYSGAPYFAAISALKVGADLAYVFCPKLAAPTIKSYSPELIVIPLEDESKDAIKQVKLFLERLHVLVIGPGLGRDSNFLPIVVELIKICRQMAKPLIIDADGLFLITQDITLVKDYEGVILTPNAIEFTRLFGGERNPKAMHNELGEGVTVIEKGVNDRIYNTSTLESYECPAGGSGRRCGGQGDLLSGALATFYCWALASKQETSPALVAGFAACYLTKTCNSYAFKTKRRSMMCSDMIEQIHQVFQDHFEH